MPFPTCDHFVPLSFTRLLTSMFPAEDKNPPTTTFPAFAATLSTEGTSAFPLPLPSGNQSAPSHWAMNPACFPPANPKVPPAKNALPINARLRMDPLTPLPGADQLEPFQRAIFFTAVSPALLKYPATCK